MSVRGETVPLNCQKWIICKLDGLIIYLNSLKFTGSGAIVHLRRLVKEDAFVPADVDQVHYESLTRAQFRLAIASHRIFTSGQVSAAIRNRCSEKIVVSDYWSKSSVGSSFAFQLHHLHSMLGVVEFGWCRHRILSFTRSVRVQSLLLFFAVDDKESTSPRFSMTSLSWSLLLRSRTSFSFGVLIFYPTYEALISPSAFKLLLFNEFSSSSRCRLAWLLSAWDFFTRWRCFAGLSLTRWRRRRFLLQPSQRPLCGWVNIGLIKESTRVSVP